MILALVLLIIFATVLSAMLLLAIVVHGRGEPQPPPKTRILGVLVCGLLGASVSLLAGPSADTPSGWITLGWNYATNAPQAAATDLWFNIYSTTNLAAPISSWQFESNVTAFNSIQRNGTNFVIEDTNYLYALTLRIQPGQRFFVATASNFWMESATSNIASTPPLPSPINQSLNIRKAQ